MGKFGYDFYFTIGGEVLTLPITPPSLNMKIGSNNKVVTLIDEGEINILKSPSLVEFEFEARFPMRKYPYSRDALYFETYMNKFTALKTEKTPFIFTVDRSTPDGKGTWRTSRRVTLEDLVIDEDADEGDDVLVSFSLKEYKDYSVKTLKTEDGAATTTSTSEEPRNTDNKGSEPETHIVQPGDSLWSIAKKYYGDGSKGAAIYEANKEVIESAAEKYRGKGKGSSNGNYLYAGTVLVIPAVDDLPTPSYTPPTPTDTKVKLTVVNDGDKQYWGRFTVYINGVKRRTGEASNYITNLNNGDKVEIVVDKGTAYIGNPSFTISRITVVTIRWGSMYG